MAVEMNQGQREAIESYQFVGELVDVRPYGSGHINDTYLVTLKENDEEKKVILQRMNKSIFTKPVELMENVLGVTSYLRERIIENGGDPERETLNVIPTAEGKPYFVDSEGEYWRAYKFITGATSYDAVETPEDFYQSAVSFGNLIVTALALILLLVLALPASYVLSRFNFRGKKILNMGFMAGLFVNISYIVIPIFLMLSEVDKALGMQVLLNNRFVLALVYASSALPFTVYLLSGYFQTLPKGFEEAAYIDGCGYFKTMVKIMIPMAKPSIITVILFNFLSFWNEYIIAYTLMDGNDTLAMGLKNLMAVEKTATNYGIMYAGLVIVMLPTLILYIAVQKRLTEGMTLGGLKG